MPAGIRTSSVIVLLAAAALLPPAAPAASFVYNFKNTDNSYALEWETPVLLPPDLRYQTVSRNSMNYCIQGGAPCSFAVFSTSFGSFEESFDAVLFGVETGGLFPQTSLTRTGAALTIQNSPLDGRVVIFQNLGDDLYEYFFKDSTGTRTFTYRAPRPLLSDIDLPIGALTDCSSPTGPCFSPISIRLDFTFFETFDMLTLIENGVSRIYAFPRLSFNRFGTVSTLPGAEQGTLVVRRVRTDGTPAPDDPIDPPPPPPPSEVPEPATVAAVAAGLAALALRRRRPRGLGLLALALAASSVASAASFVYYYEDRTRERNRFQWETRTLRRKPRCNRSVGA
ncbi:MAG: PEP-CTERM sorting domain-containing protein [Bryobacteraceae bacterium]|nr:PEP-CTERM sorting domain-containing protein [Bryobacteraceae bacterium]